jgi:hypothetical protein
MGKPWLGAEIVDHGRTLAGAEIVDHGRTLVGGRDCRSWENPGWGCLECTAMSVGLCLNIQYTLSRIKVTVMLSVDAP